MGNNNSSEGSGGDARPITGLSCVRKLGSLGSGKSELDKRCKPSGLYPSCNWEDRAIRRLIGDGKLAARQIGSEDRKSTTDRECPICFLQYPEVNVTSCCQANICTECYLQVRPQKTKDNVCPFCNNNKLTVGVASEMDVEDFKEREAEEQRATEATIRTRANTDTTDAGEATLEANATPPLSPGGFGSSLEQNETVRRMRARSESVSSETTGIADSPVPEEQMLRQMSLTLEDRQLLEKQVKAQHTHPLARRIEAEAENRRVSNEREYHQTNSGRIQEARVAELLRFQGSSISRIRRRAPASGTVGSSDERRRGWNQIVDAFERGGNGTIQTLDDFVVLEAALILSVEQENRRTSTPSVSDENGNEFDAPAPARAGFPLGLMSGQTDGNDPTSSQANGSPAASHEDRPENTLVRSFLNSPARRLRGTGQRLRAGRSMSNATMHTARMLMRGITEEEQVAMAIAESLRESEIVERGSNGGGENQDQEVIEENSAGNMDNPILTEGQAHIPVPCSASVPEQDRPCNDRQEGTTPTTCSDQEIVVDSDLKGGEAQMAMTSSALAPEQDRNCNDRQGGTTPTTCNDQGTLDPTNSLTDVAAINLTHFMSEVLEQVGSADTETTFNDGGASTSSQNEPPNLSSEKTAICSDQE